MYAGGVGSYQRGDLRWQVVAPDLPSQEADTFNELALSLREWDA